MTLSRPFLALALAALLACGEDRTGPGDVHLTGDRLLHIVDTLGIADTAARGARARRCIAGSSGSTAAGQS